MTTTEAAPRCTRIVGPPRSGKTRELLARIAAAPPEYGKLVASPHPLAARRLGGYLLGTFAMEILNDNAFASGLALELDRIDDVDAEAHFEQAAASLFSLEWVELVEPELGDAPSLDYEIAGLRAPERFAQAAYRLIRKLRGANISPERFLEIARRKATEWYANPPNLANPDLLFSTAEKYRDSLDVNPAELERQRRRELDLAKILAGTYERYVVDAEERGCLSETDAVAEATRVLQSLPDAAANARARYPLAFVDDAQDLTLGELAFLQAMYGEGLDGVTLAGDPDQATRTFAGARPERVFACGNALELACDDALVAAAQEVLHRKAVLANVGDRLRVYRAGTQEAEARFIAREIAAELRAGTRPESIAVLVRSLRLARPYIAALLETGISIRLFGDLDLLANPCVEDALSLLWAAQDPFRHDWLLRAMQTPTLRLSDATLVTLCGEPPQPQAALFAEVEGEDENPSPAREREVRLAQNVMRGDRDADLEAEARERLERFRSNCARWKALFATVPLEDAARVVFVEGGLFADDAGSNAAQNAYRRDILERLLERIAIFARADRTRTLGDALAYLERIATSEWPQCDAGTDGAGVVVAAIEAIKGRSYDAVFVPGLRAGTFPPYWVPDAFVFTTGFGMIPKDNVGDARAARTAKFTWYMHNAKVREHHAAEHRRLLYCAMTRAEERLTLSAWGTPTKGTAAPELLAEIQNLGGGFLRLDS
ncbi:MAG: ATP-dependent helicase [Candidatus Eremiobacteraeota bacterium]|nr:ATP-dependent helicase [Candidatus Eremiobacteraeota bacterium]